MQREIKYSFKQWCEDNGHAEWLDLWDYELNGVGPEEVSYGSNQFFWLKCSRGLHDSDKWKPADLIKKAKPLCCRQCHSFGQWMIDSYGSNAIEKYRAPEEQLNWFDISPRTSSTKVRIKCHNAAHPNYEITPYKFVLGHRCSVCSNKQVIAGINDVATTHPERVKYFKYPEDATKYTVHSGKQVWFKCPDCGTEKYSSLDATFREGHYACRACGDGVSYANKFIGELLRQLSTARNMTIESEKIFEWSRLNSDGKQSRIYDFYVVAQEDVIIEVHGVQHYGEMVNRGIFRDYEVEHANDIFKQNLALTNGILPQNYIEINCSKSNKDFIKQSVLDSNLPIALNFCVEDIDWDKCDVYASTTNFVKEAARLWQSGVRSLSDISAQFGCSKSTVGNYLALADKLGWINYVTKRRKPVICYDNGLVFASPKACSIYSLDVLGVSLRPEHVSGCANGRYKATHNLHFGYLTMCELRQIMTNEPHRVFGIEYLCQTA